MIVALFVLSVAHADPSIQPVEAGATVRATVPSYLLPESAYDTCLANTIALRDGEAALETAVSEATRGFGVVREALSSCESQLALDGEEIGELAIALEQAQMDVLKWKGQRNTAIAVAGGAILTGAIAVWIQTRE